MFGSVSVLFRERDDTLGVPTGRLCPSLCAFMNSIIAAYDLLLCCCCCGCCCCCDDDDDGSDCKFSLDSLRPRREEEEEDVVPGASLRRLARNEFSVKRLLFFFGRSVMGLVMVVPLARAG